jgi:hypothetical protein
VSVWCGVSVSVFGCGVSLCAWCVWVWCFVFYEFICSVSFVCCFGFILFYFSLLRESRLALWLIPTRRKTTKIRTAFITTRTIGETWYYFIVIILLLFYLNDCCCYKYSPLLFCNADSLPPHTHTHTHTQFCECCSVALLLCCSVALT